MALLVNVRDNEEGFPPKLINLEQLVIFDTVVHKPGNMELKFLLTRGYRVDVKNKEAVQRVLEDLQRLEPGLC